MPDAPGAKFCSECGSPIRRLPNCNASNEPSSTFSSVWHSVDRGMGDGVRGMKPAPETTEPYPTPQTPNPSPASTGERRRANRDVLRRGQLDRPRGEARPGRKLQDFMRSYQESCSAVIQHFDGFIAKYMGDGLLVHFGYPTAHEDDAQRAVRAGLGMLEAMRNSEIHTSHGKKIPVEIPNRSFTHGLVSASIR